MGIWEGDGRWECVLVLVLVLTLWWDAIGPTRQAETALGGYERRLCAGGRLSQARQRTPGRQQGSRDRDMPDRSTEP